MSNIYKAFDNGKAFIPFVTCGDPDLNTTAAVVRAAAQSGADLIELGVPFSDPVAEGPVIQEASMRALAGGATTDKIFDLVVDLRKDVSIPLVFMTYANVVFSYGTERFVKRCAEVGVDGVILPDVPFEEKEDFAPICDRYGIDFISLVAPTSENRLAMIAEEAKGFLYVVSSLGVTGVRSEIKTDIPSLTEVVRKHARVPFAIGFGVSRPDQATQMARYSNGVIVGSAIMKIIAEHGKESPSYVAAYVKEMKEAIASL